MDRYDLDTRKAMKEAYQTGKSNSSDVRIVTASSEDNDQFELKIDPCLEALKNKIGLQRTLKRKISE